MDFSQIALIFFFAALFGLVSRILRQPLFVGYLLAGLFISWTGIVKDLTYFESLGHIGVTLLLFLMGLEMNIKDVKSVGKTAIITGMFQMLGSFIGGFGVASIMGFSSMSSFYVGVALSFSSTIVSIKLISEKKDLVSLYGRIAIGILLVQDLVALGVLSFLVSGQNHGDFFDWSFVALKALVLILAVWYLSKKIIPQAFEKFVGSSSDFLFVFALPGPSGLPL